MDKKNKLVCRICLEECHKKVFLFEYKNNVKYSDLIKEYIGIELFNKGNLPEGLCKRCQSDLNAAVRFISKIRVSSEKLNSVLTWNTPLIFSSFIKYEETKTNISDLQDEYDIKFDTNNIPTDNSDSESEISLQVLKTKNIQIKNVFDSNSEELSQYIVDEQIIKVEDVEIKHDEDYLKTKCVVLKKEEFGLRKDMVKCLTCGILSINRSAFIVHYRKHSGEKPHKCSHCNMRYSQVGTLNTHIKKIHPKAWDKIRHKAKKLKKLKQEEALRNSKLSTEPQNEGGDGDQNDNKSRLRVTCEICGKSYYHKYALNVHMRVHNVDKQVQCPFCPQRFVQSGDRLIHIRIHHTGEKPFICHVCAKSFASGTNLRVHLLSHSNERKFKCDICHKGMKTKDNLKRHLLVMHSQTKGKVCHICGKAYALTYKLNNHMKIWHARSGDCDICKKTFKNIESHMKTHSAEKTKADKYFKCHMCHKSFSKQKNLMDHVQKHQNEKAAFKCSYEDCSSAFAKKRVLDFHVLKYHLKQTPHTCQFCNRGFYRKGDLGQHLKTSHVPYTLNVS